MGRRCSKKAVRCGAIGVRALACTRRSFSSAGGGATPLRDSLLAERLLSERIPCLRCLFPEFAVIIMPTVQWQIVPHGRKCLASDPAPLPDTNTCEPPCCGQDRSIMP